MGNCFTSVNGSLHDAILINANCGQQIQGVFVARIDTVEHQGHDDFLPGRTTLVPEFRLLQRDNVTDILHNTMQCARCQDFIFVVVSDGNEQFRVSVVHGRTEIVSISQGELVRITSGSGVYLH